MIHFFVAWFTSPGWWFFTGIATSLVITSLFSRAADTARDLNVEEVKALLVCTLLGPVFTIIMIAVILFLIASFIWEVYIK